MGRKDEIIERVRAVAEPLATQEGLELIDVQLGGSGRPELTLFIDKIPGAQGTLAANMPPANDAAPDAPAENLDETTEGKPLELIAHGTRAEHIEDDVQDVLAESDEEFQEGDEMSIEVETPASGTRPGVTLDDCANFSRIVSSALDVEDPLDAAYELVVSSPGLDRPLRTPAHYQRYIGKRVRVKTYAPVPDAGNRKTFVGNLLGYDEAKSCVLIDVDGTHFAVPRAAISKANLDPVFDI